jgi:hypothetical protein
MRCADECCCMQLLAAVTLAVAFSDMASQCAAFFYNLDLSDGVRRGH